MPMYRVTKTETVQVWARDERRAELRANEEFQDAPNASYEITRLTPLPNLNRILASLEEHGLSVYLDDYRNNIHDFIRLDTKSVTEEWRYMLVCSLNDEEEYDGTGYALMTAEAVDIAQFPHLDPDSLSIRVLQALKQFEEENPEEIEQNATMEEITELLIKAGLTASLEPQDWRGMPAWISIGETVDFYADGTPDYFAEFTLYQNVTETFHVDGTGYHLSRGDDESDIVLRIPNETGMRVVSQIVWAMAQEAKGANE
jgi:hypothetical protein